MQRTTSARIAFVGHGAMAQSVQAILAAQDGHGLETVAFLTGGKERSGPWVGSMAELLSRKPDLVVECASGDALMNHGTVAARTGVPLLVASVGALLRPDVRSRLEGWEHCVSFVAGAIGGLDLLRTTAATGALEAVRYISCKPVQAWRGTYAEQLVDLSALAEPATFYSGNAFDASALFPFNANVCAAIALSGLGPFETQVSLQADPDIQLNQHSIIATGRFGQADFRFTNFPLPENPKTSALAAHSIAAALLDPVLRIPFASIGSRITRRN